MLVETFEISKPSFAMFGQTVEMFLQAFAMFLKTF